MTCSKCGYNNREDSSFCSLCGTPFPPQSQGAVPQQAAPGAPGAGNAVNTQPPGTAPQPTGGTPYPGAAQGYPNQPAYGQQSGAMPPYGQPAYGQPTYGQPAQGQPSYGQPVQGQYPYGQAQQGQQLPYGQPYAGMYPQPGSYGAQPVPYAPQSPYGQAPYVPGQPHTYPTGQPQPVPLAPHQAQPSAFSSQQKPLAGLLSLFTLDLLLRVLVTAFVVYAGAKGTFSLANGYFEITGTNALLWFGLLCALPAIALLATLITYFGRKKSFRVLYVLYNISQLVFLVQMSMLLMNAEREPLYPASFVQGLTAGFAALFVVWTIYLFASKRTRETFGIKVKTPAPKAEKAAENTHAMAEQPEPMPKTEATVESGVPAPQAPTAATPAKNTAPSEPPTKQAAEGGNPLMQPAGQDESSLGTLQNSGGPRPPE